MPEEDPTPAAIEAQFRNLIHEVSHRRHTVRQSSCRSTRSSGRSLTKNVCIDPWLPEVLETSPCPHPSKLLHRRRSRGAGRTSASDLCRRNTPAGDPHPPGVSRRHRGSPESGGTTVRICRRTRIRLSAASGLGGHSSGTLHSRMPSPEGLSSMRTSGSSPTAPLQDQLSADGWKGLLDQWEALISGSRGGVVGPCCRVPVRCVARAVGRAPDGPV